MGFIYPCPRSTAERLRDAGGSYFNWSYTWPPSTRLHLAVRGCLTGKALEWANAVWREGDAVLDQFEEFTRRFRAVFDHPLFLGNRGLSRGGRESARGGV